LSAYCTVVPLIPAIDVAKLILCWVLSLDLEIESFWHVYRGNA